MDDLWFWVRVAAGIRQKPFLTMDGKVAEITVEKVEELQAMERSVNAKPSNHLNFKVGDQVRVSDGAFTGLKATVYQMTDSARVQLLLDFLGQKTKVELAADQIQAAA